MSKDSYIEFEAPSGFRLPEGTKIGDAFTLVCDFKLKGDGKTICLTQLGELPLSENKEDKRADYREMTSKMQSEWSQNQTG